MKDQKALADELERLNELGKTWAMAVMSAIENGQEADPYRAMLKDAQNGLAFCVASSLPTILTALRAEPTTSSRRTRRRRPLTCVPRSSAGRAASQRLSTHPRTQRHDR